MLSDGVEKGRWMGPLTEYGGGLARKVCRGFPLLLHNIHKETEMFNNTKSIYYCNLINVKQRSN